MAMDWLDAWKIADHAAMRATRAAAAKSLLALQRRGELPSDAERAEVKRLRDLANALFREGMAQDLLAPCVRSIGSQAAQQEVFGN